ncbi:MAG TPA: hypothetical protein VKC55_08320 [Actinomycetota bacterium]|nr:hypothetical protein [Actinomycetota bacterium]
MRRLVLLPLAVLLLASCGYQPEIDNPGTATGVTGRAPSAASSAPTGPTSTSAAFTEDGCPVDDPDFCRQATFLANALVLSDSHAVFDLSREVTLHCADLDESLYAQCKDESTLKGYIVGSHQGEFFVAPPKRFRDLLSFFVEAVDTEYSDELGGPQMQILGISTCGKGASTSYHVAFTVALSDPNSTLPGDRFLGTYQFTQEQGEWAIEVAYFALYTDWQLVLDDPLTEIGCGDIQPWAGSPPNVNPPQSESQPTPIPTPSASPSA